MPRWTHSMSAACRSWLPDAHRGHLVAGVRAEHGPVVQRAAVGVTERQTGLLTEKIRRGDVIRRVAQHGAAADAAELRLGPRVGGDDRRPDVDVGVELAGEDARHAVGGRADVEDAAAHRRLVDELLEDARQDHGRTAAEPERPEDALEVGARRGEERDVRAVGAQHPVAGALLGDEEVAVLDLLDDAGDHVAHRRRRPRRHRGDADAGHLEAGRRRAGAVDRIDDEDELGVGRALQPAVLE